jgi:hypothetical protein
MVLDVTWCAWAGCLAGLTHAILARDLAAEYTSAIISPGRATVAGTYATTRNTCRISLMHGATLLHTRMWYVLLGSNRPNRILSRSSTFHPEETPFSPFVEGVAVQVTPVGPVGTTVRRLADVPLDTV